MGSIPNEAAPRVVLLDALRAFALFGILQVNIQSYVWGASSPLGMFAEVPALGDSAAYLLVGALAQTKFVALFAFLFGVGFALQMKSILAMRAPAPSMGARAPLAYARAVYRRRLWFLLAVGVLHGVLLYYGDILTAYALAGFILVLYAGVRPARLARAARNWLIAYAVLTVAWLVVYEAARRATPIAGDASEIPQALIDTFLLNTEGGYWQMLPQRVQDYLSVTGTTLFLSLPFVVGLFLLGALAGRQGWLTHPGRHPRLWRRAFWLGLAALPFAVAGAWLDYRGVLDTPGDAGAAGLGLMAVGFALMAFYVALIVRWQHAAPVAWAIRWLAPAGRMPLTNYLLQSLIMGVLLSGWGLGLGMQWRHAEQALLALAIVVVQIVASRFWIARIGQGPVEALWRRATYGRRGAAAA